MPMKKRGGHRRGAARRAGEGRKTGRGSVPRADAGSGKQRDAAPATRGGEPRKFQARRPKGSFGARDAQPHGLRTAESREPSSFESPDKSRSQAGPRWRTDAPVAGRGRPKSSHDSRKPRERTFEQRPPRQAQPEARPAPAPLPEIATGVQTVTVGADEAGMRVDRFFEARFPGLSFSHIQRIVRKGEVRVDSKRVDTKDRLAIGQQVRIPPLKLNVPKRTSLSPEDEKTRDFLKSITLFEDADVLVLNKPMGLSVQGGSGTTRHLDGML